ncbi:MAG: fimbrillin family protein [Bacteroidales bacterium]|nr:fimbrillin family protein [Bacteroidales bacterium]
MKKTTLILAGIALIAASCAKTEVVSSGPDGAEKGISFSAYTARPTKAAQVDVNTGNLSTFQATAIGSNSTVYFDNITFSRNSTTPTVWESSPAYFWPVYALDFYAYNKPEKGTFTPNIYVSGQTITFSPSTTLSEQEDLVAASATGQSAPTTLNGAIDLQFHHYLTQVVVNAKCSNRNYTVDVYGVKLANMAGEGTYTFSTTAESTGNMVATPEMVNSGTSSDYISTFTTAKTLTAEAAEVMAETSGKWYLIPQTVKPWDRENNMTNKDALSSTTSTYDHGTYLALKVMITMTNSNSSNSTPIAIYPKTGEPAWMAVPVPSQLAFEQGKKYNVTVDFFSDQNKGGAGYVDPEKPGELDGDEDTDDSGKAIVGGVIKFNATVDTWDSNTVTVNISL